MAQTSTTSRNLFGLKKIETPGNGILSTIEERTQGIVTSMAVGTRISGSPRRTVNNQSFFKNGSSDVSNSNMEETTPVTPISPDCLTFILKGSTL